MDQARRAENKLGLAEHLADASARLGVSTFALALLLAGAEPEELATALTAALRGVPSIARGPSDRPARRRLPPICCLERVIRDGRGPIGPLTWGGAEGT